MQGDTVPFSFIQAVILLETLVKVMFQKIILRCSVKQSH